VDARRFNTFAKSLSTTGDRRAATRALTAALLATIIGLRQRPAAAGSCRQRRDRCDVTEDCCDHLACRTIAACYGARRDGTRCCVTHNDRCHDDCDCCGTLLCLNHHCRTT